MKVFFLLLLSSSCSGDTSDELEEEIKYHFEPNEEEDRAVLFKVQVLRSSKLVSSCFFPQLVNLKKPRQNTVKDTRLWPNGILYVFFDENLTPELLQGLRYAIAKIEHFSCIHFSKLERNQIGFSPYLNITLVPQRYG